jgi:CRP/FNR family transcriptional regulator, cyclic AMP receptor protein
MLDSKLLKEERFFADLTDTELEVMAKITSQKNFKTGETIFKESEEGQSLYVIRSGEVKASGSAPNGEVFTLTMLKDGDIFGQMSFIDGRPRSATIIAASDVNTIVMEKSDFEGIIDDNPRLIHKIMGKIVLNVHSILRGMNARYMEMINYMWGRKRFT